ncbi:hypothetical protein M426DRAFT_320377 [Hypoxylon sp. CI-4A]|nr:hypothetical protein M426DRAFT_320377 [Hypoxylon sp. CI-4A]
MSFAHQPTSNSSSYSKLKKTRLRPRKAKKPGARRRNISSLRDPKAKSSSTSTPTRMSPRDSLTLISPIEQKPSTMLADTQLSEPSHSPSIYKSTSPNDPSPSPSPSPYHAFPHATSAYRPNSTEPSRLRVTDERNIGENLGGVIICELCEDELPGSRYWCEECSDSFCLECYLAHPREHILKLVGCGTSETSPLSSSEGSTNNPSLRSNGNSEDKGNEGHSDDGKLRHHDRLQLQLQQIFNSQITITLEDLIHFTAKVLASGKSMGNSDATEQGLSRQIVSILENTAHQATQAYDPEHKEDHDDGEDQHATGDNSYSGNGHVDNNQDALFNLLKLGGHRTRKRSGPKSGRVWLPQEQQRLRELKDKGWSNVRIAIELKRSEGAISQQWRKQSGQT